MAFDTSSGRGRRPLAEINVTPLVDVMLVLLIIFMVTAPLIQTGVKVDLPKTKTPPIESKEEKLVVSIKKDKRVYIQNVEVPYDKLGEKLATNAKLKRDRELYIQADRALPYGVVVEVMALAKAAGAETVGMVTDLPEVRR
jgi:biopolymer transport protein TolR